MILLPGVQYRKTRLAENIEKSAPPGWGEFKRGCKNTVKVSIYQS